MAALDLSSPALELSFLPTPLSVIQLKPSQAIPSKLLQALTGAGDAHSFVSITRCPDEISIILPASQFEELYPPTVRLLPLLRLPRARPRPLSTPLGV